MTPIDMDPASRAAWAAAEAAARDQLREISRDLDAIRFRLLGVQAILPRSPQEEDPLMDSDIADSSAGLRAAIGCVLQDRIDPALRDLREAASTEGATPLRGT